MIKIGLVGLGGMGTVHYTNYQYIQDCKVAAVVGTTEKDKQTADSWGLTEYSTITDMLDHEDIDVVDICTPTFTHYQLTKEALLRNKNVIVEKPFTLHLKEAEELFALSENSGKHVYVGQVIRFAKDTEILEQLIKNKEYGEVKDAYFARLSKVPGWSTGNWMLDKNKSGQLAFDLHIHDLDTIIHLFGTPLGYSYTIVKSKESKYTELYRIQYDFDAYHVAAEAAWFHADYPFNASWRVYFENAVAVGNSKQVIIYPYNGETRIIKIHEKQIPTGINLAPTEMFYSELSYYMDCVRKNIDPPKTPKQEILNVVRILEKLTF